MANKRPNSPFDTNLPSDEPSKRARTNGSVTGNALQVTSATPPLIEVDEKPFAGNKSNQALGHGFRFQSKLLMLYAMRAVNAGYQFYLGTELEDVGGKFDDLIFKYKDKNDTTYGAYYYLQAKHKLNENAEKEKIKEDHLIYHGKDTGIFDLRKYFQSYVKIKSRGEDIEHCIICTNVDFDKTDLTKEGIELNPLVNKDWPKILDCAKDKPQQFFYKFKVNDKLRNHMLRNHMLRDSLMVNDFFGKLIFAVNTPNEDELDLILAKEVGKYFKLSNNVLPSAYVMNEMINWFKRKDNLWLSAKEVENILMEKAGELMALCHITSLSIDYQEQLQKVIEFNDTAIYELKQKLNKFWKNPPAKVEFVRSETPKLTAVKVISAVNKMLEFPNKDDYLVISANRLKGNEKDLNTSMKIEICHNLLIVVDEDAKQQLKVNDCENLIPVNSRKKIIVISNQDFIEDGSLKDQITCKHLSEETKQFIGKRQVSFQGINLTVSELIDMSQADKILDSQTIDNLVQVADNKKIVISSSSSSSSFDKTHYIRRSLKFPSEDYLLKKLDKQWAKTTDSTIHEEIKIDPNGKIQWLVENYSQKSEIWAKLKALIGQTSSSRTVSEEGLINATNKRVIVTGVAGMGKSTILSNYYHEIKRTKPDILIIKISLMDFVNALKRLKEVNKESVNDFFINCMIDQSPFARLLLKHRFETGDRIVLMLDGFDEIDNECKDIVIELVKNLNESIPLYITTRPYMADELQFNLSQLAYSIAEFPEGDQIDYMTSIWKDFIFKENIKYEEKTIRSFAKMLVDRVANTLGDKEKEFIGIPLQCRIVAECFQSKLLTVKTLDDFSLLLEGQQFNLVSIYKMMIEEKRRVFREEKIKIHSFDSHIVTKSIEYIIKETELHLRKLAIQIFDDYEQYYDDFFNPEEFQTEIERKEKEEQLDEFGIRFGLLNKKSDGNRIQFVHRTYAEYLVADFIYKGFHQDDKRHNKLLENESVRNWIIEETFVRDEYNGVRVFIDSMLSSTFSDEFRKKIQGRNLPDRFNEFVISLVHNTNIDHYGRRVLKVAFEERNANILIFCFSCLEETSQNTRSEIRTAIAKFIEAPFNQRTDVFNRILNYFNDADDDQLRNILAKLCKDSFSLLMLNEMEIKQVNVKHNVEHLLNFMYNCRKKVILMFEKHLKDAFHYMPVFLIHFGCDNLMKKYFKLISFIYSDDVHLTNFIKEVIDEYLERRKDWQVGQIEKTLVILRELGRTTMLPELSRYVLIRNSSILQQDENIDIRLSLEEMGMTGLHGAAFRGDLSSIEQEIGSSLENSDPETYSEEVRNSVHRLIVDANNGDISPLYVAAAYGQEEMFRKIVIFLPNSIDEGMNGLNNLLIDAIKYDNAQMLQTILRFGKAEVGGQNAIVQLLQPMFRNISFSKRLVETLARTVVQDNKNVGYQHLKDLLFQNESTLCHLKNVPNDILQEIIVADGGFNNWINNLLDTNVKQAIHELTKFILKKINREDQLPKLIDIVVTSPLPNKTYWSMFVEFQNYYLVESFLERVLNSCNEEDLKKLFFSRDENKMVVLFRFLIWESRDCFNREWLKWPESLQNEIEDLWEKETPQLIDHLFSSPTFVGTLDNKPRFNAIEYYLKNGSEEQLLKFSKVVRLNKLDEACEHIVRFETEGEKKCNEFVCLLKKKLAGSETEKEYDRVYKNYRLYFNDKGEVVHMPREENNFTDGWIQYHGILYGNRSFSD